MNPHRHGSLRGGAALNLPDGWQQRRLGDGNISHIVMGQSPDSSTYSLQPMGLPFYQGKVDFGRRSPRHRVWCPAPARTAQAGDVLISVRAPIGDVNIAIETCGIGRGLAAIRGKSAADSTFLYLSLIACKDNLESKGTGATFKAINKDALHELMLALPPLREQRGIVRMLITLEDRIELAHKIVATLKELRAATMAKIFREGALGESAKMTDIGEIPKSWELVPLKEVCSFSSGGTPARNRPEYWNGGVPWVKTAEVNYRTIEWTGETISELGLRDSSAKIFPQGTVLMAMYGQGVTRGKVARLGIAAATNQACLALIPNADIDGGYLYTSLVLSYDRLRELGHGANQRNLSADIVRNFTIPLPPTLGEQRKIHATMEKVAQRGMIAEAKLETLNALFASTLNLLMTGQVRLTAEMIERYGRDEGKEKARVNGGRVDEAILKQVVDRIVEAIHPEKIILFGSAARGEMGPDSDVDLLVVKTVTNRRETAGQVYGALTGLGVAKDVVVATPEDLEEYADLPGNIIRPALREGRVLYDARR